MQVDKSKIKEIKDFQLGSEVAANQKANFDLLADAINQNDTNIQQNSERIDSLESSSEMVGTLHPFGSEFFGGILNGEVQVTQGSAVGQISKENVFFYKQAFVFKKDTQYFSMSEKSSDYNVESPSIKARTDKYFIHEDKQYYFNGTTLVLLSIPEAPKDGKQYGRKNGAWDVIQKDPNALVKTAQSLSEAEQTQVQTNIGVKNTVDVVGVGTPVKVTEVWRTNNYRTVEGLIYGTATVNIYKALKVNIGDIVIGTLKGSVNMSVLSKVDNSNNFIQSIIRGTNNVEKIFYIVDYNGYIEISAVLDLNIYIIPCKLASALTPLGGPNRKLYEAAGAKFNEDTGYYELNGLTDITEDEMVDIYSRTKIANSGLNLDFYLFNTPASIRTNIAPDIALQTGWLTINTNRNIAYYSRCEIIAICPNNSSTIYLNDLGNYFFHDCPNLKEIKGILVFRNIGKIEPYVFLKTPKLTKINIKELKTSISFKDSPLLSKESLQYMVENSAATSAITITLHADVYAKVASAEAEWGTIFTLAQTKNISFAQG